MYQNLSTDEWRACLAVGTKILIADGSYKNIEDIRQGNLVTSFDAATGGRIDASVASIIQRQDPIITINDVLKAAPDEVLYLANGKFADRGSTSW